jgi:hypothetical protein
MSTTRTLRVTDCARCGETVALALTSSLCAVCVELPELTTTTIPPRETTPPRIATPEPPVNAWNRGGRVRVRAERWARLRNPPNPEHAVSVELVSFHPNGGANREDGWTVRTSDGAVRFWASASLELVPQETTPTSERVWLSYSEWETLTTDNRLLWADGNPNDASSVGLVVTMRHSAGVRTRNSAGVESSGSWSLASVLSSNPSAPAASGGSCGGPVTTETPVGTLVRFTRQRWLGFNGSQRELYRLASPDGSGCNLTRNNASDTFVRVAFDGAIGDWMRASLEIVAR